MRPFGVFVHHQGRGHATRCAALVNALPAERPVTVFCARPEAIPPLRRGSEVVALPSLFEAHLSGGAPPALDAARTPRTLHCAPLGWPGIRRAMARLTAWFDAADPALMIVDVSAEVAQLCRIASVPCVPVLQHGDRTDPGHVAAYEGAVGILAPFDARLDHPERPAWMRAMTHHAGGLGVAGNDWDRAAARRAIGVAQDARLVVVVSGGGGSGLPLAPLTMAARAVPDALWLTLGRVAGEWHETGAANLVHSGWVEAPEPYLAAADVVVGQPGNTLVHQVLSLGRPFLAVPEWRYFGEQQDKARALMREGVAHTASTWPDTPHGWRDALAAAEATDAVRARSMVRPDAAPRAARWLEALAEGLWRRPEALEAAE